MKIEINTTEKTIKILEDITSKELMDLMNSIKDIDQYRLIQTKEFVYVTQPVYYQTSPYYPSTNPSFPIVYTTSTDSAATFTSNIRYNND